MFVEHQLPCKAFSLEKTAEEVHTSEMAGKRGHMTDLVAIAVFQFVFLSPHLIETMTERALPPDEGHDTKRKSYTSSARCWCTCPGQALI